MPLNLAKIVLNPMRPRQYLLPKDCCCTTTKIVLDRFLLGLDCFVFVQDPDAIAAIFEISEVNTIGQTYSFVKCSSRPVASEAAERWSLEGMDTDWDVMAATDSKQLCIHEREVRFRMKDRCAVGAQSRLAAVTIVW